MIDVRHVSEPDSATEERDQYDFDEAVKREGKWALEGLAAVGIVLAIAMSAVALAKSGGSGSHPALAAKTVTVEKAAASGTVLSPEVVSLKVIGGSKLGPDGKKHDEFTRTEFHVKAGQPLQLKIDNTDDVDHSITAPGAGLNVAIKPGVHTYTLVIPKAGVYSWVCIIPCDSDANGWAMSHDGYMAGNITVS